MPQVQITLTPAESKRLIARGVSRLPEVRRALEEGTIVICVGTTNGYVAEEIGLKIDRRRFAAGVVLPKGTCALRREKRLREIVVRRGRRTGLTLDDVSGKLRSRDVVIKGANALDSDWNAGVMVGSEDWGTVGKLKKVVGRGKAKLIIPVGLEKFIPDSLASVMNATRMEECRYATGLPVRIAMMGGKVITEIEAIKILTGADAWAIGRGGVSGAEGSVTLAASGTEKQLRALKMLISGLKGEKPVRISAGCGECKYSSCFRKKRSDFQ
ncbi:MAG: hypothetical protein QXG10_04730 [Candidatus Hadarchaeales archaeon]